MADGEYVLFSYIGTTDIQVLMVDVCPQGNCMSVSIEYVEGTLSPGALVSVIRIIDGVLDFVNMRLVAIPRSMSENFTINNVTSGWYRVIAFDLESNGLPQMPISVAADSKTIIVNSVELSELPETLVLIYTRPLIRIKLINSRSCKRPIPVSQDTASPRIGAPGELPS